MVLNSKILNVIDISTPFESEMKQWIELFAQKLDIKISNNYNKYDMRSTPDVLISGPCTWL